MSNKQSKRASFYAKQKTMRPARRIIRENRGKPGFVGAALSLTVNGKTFGPGAFFITP